jgi:RHS repeat-associated protein
VYVPDPETDVEYGFTGHEHLDAFKMINMSGRMYDPVLGRFLSPDPFLQFPDFTQGLNPYSYALNNPLRFVDPDGYSLFGTILAITLQILVTPINPVLGAVVFSVVMTIDYAIENGWGVNISDLAQYFAQTFAMSAASMGTTKAIGSMFDQMKNTLMREVGRAAAQGLFNGGMRMIQGGKFEHGFLSGFVSSLGGSAMIKYGANMDIGSKVALSAALGGTAEVLGGGKFANGAVTGAYVMMFNHLMEQTPPDDPPRKVDAISGNSHDPREPIYFELDEHFVDENTTYFFHKDTSVLYCIKVETQYYYLDDLETMGYVPRVNNPTTSIGFQSFYALMNLSANVWSPPGFPWTTTTTAWTNFVNMRRKTVVYETRKILNDE